MLSSRGSRWRKRARRSGCRVAIALRLSKQRRQTRSEIESRPSCRWLRSCNTARACLSSKSEGWQVNSPSHGVGTMKDEEMSRYRPTGAMPSMTLSSRQRRGVRIQRDCFGSITPHRRRSISFEHSPMVDSLTFERSMSGTRDSSRTRRSDRVTKRWRRRSVERSTS